MTITRLYKPHPLFVIKATRGGIYFMPIFTRSKEKLNAFNSKEGSNRFSYFVNDPDQAWDYLNAANLTEMPNINLNKETKFLIQNSLNYGMGVFFKAGSQSYKSGLWFSSSIKWLYQSDLGSYVERYIASELKVSYENQLRFKQNFLRYQKQNYLFFNYGLAINSYSLSSARLLFSKNNLLKLIRLILPVYWKTEWDLLSNQDKFQLSKNLLFLTRAKGSYKYLNAFLQSNHDGIVHDLQTKMLSIYGEKIFYHAFTLDINKVKFNSEGLNLVTLSGRETISLTKSQKFFKSFKLVALLTALLVPAVISRRAQPLSFYSNFAAVRQHSCYSPVYSSALPFAMITSSQPQLFSSQATQSRKALKIQSLLGAKLDSPRNCVVAFWHSKQANDIIAGKTKTKTIDVVIYSQNQAEKNENYSVEKWTLNNYVDAYQNRTLDVRNSQNPDKKVYTLLLKNTPLGTTYKSTTSIAEYSSITGRNFITDLIIVDLDNQTNLHWSIPVNFDEKSEVPSYVLKKLSRALTYIHASKVNLFKTSALGTMFSKFCEANNISELNLDETFGGRSDIELFQKLQKNFRLPETKSYQAAHIVPERTSTNLSIERKGQLTNHTMKCANGTTSYDHESVNMFNLIQSKDISSMLTSNLQEGYRRLNNHINKLINPKSSENLLALVLLRDVSHDFYQTSRILLGMEITNNSLLKYSHLRQVDNPCLLELLSILGPQIALNEKVCDTCVENFPIILQNSNATLARLNTASVVPLNDTPSNTQIGVGVGILDESNAWDQTFESLDKDLNLLFNDLNCAIESKNTFLKVEAITAISHSILNNHSQEEMSKFLEKNMLLASSAASGPLDISAYSESDGQFLMIHRNKGNLVYNTFNSIETVVRSIKMVLNEKQQRLRQAVSNRELTPIQQQKVQEMLHRLQQYDGFLANVSRELTTTNSLNNPLLKETTLSKICSNSDTLKKTLMVVNAIYDKQKNPAKREYIGEFDKLYNSLLQEEFFVDTFNSAQEIAADGYHKTGIYWDPNNRKMSEDLFKSPPNLGLTGITVIPPEESQKAIIVRSDELAAIGSIALDTRKSKRTGSVPLNSLPSKPRLTSIANQNMVKKSAQDMALVSRKPYTKLSKEASEKILANQKLEDPGSETAPNTLHKQIVEKRPCGRPPKSNRPER